VVPRQRQFRADLAVVNECLDELILLAKRTQQPEDIEALQQRDYTKVDAAPLAA
jgi:cytochrome P450 family 97 subfamily B polypeptide 3